MRNQRITFMTQAAMIAPDHPPLIHPRCRPWPVYRLPDRKYLRRSDPAGHPVRKPCHFDRRCLYVSSAGQKPACRTAAADPGQHSGRPAGPSLWIRRGASHPLPHAHHRDRGDPLLRSAGTGAVLRTEATRFSKRDRVFLIWDVVFLKIPRPQLIYAAYVCPLPAVILSISLQDALRRSPLSPSM